MKYELVQHSNHTLDLNKIHNICTSSDKWNGLIIEYHPWIDLTVSVFLSIDEVRSCKIIDNILHISEDKYLIFSNNKYVQDGGIDLQFEIRHFMFFKSDLYDIYRYIKESKQDSNKSKTLRVTYINGNDKKDILLDINKMEAYFCTSKIELVFKDNLYEARIIDLTRDMPTVIRICINDIKSPNHKVISLKIL